MDRTQDHVSPTLIEGVTTWLKQSALKDTELETIAFQTCDRLAAIGIPLARVHLSFAMLHPLYTSLSYTWRRGQDVSVEGFSLPSGKTPPERYLASPYYQLVSKNLSHLRRRLAPDTPSEFPIFDDLKALGVTDYLAFRQSFAGNDDRGMLGSWATDDPHGFSEDMIRALLNVENNLAVAAHTAVLRKLAGNMLTTYLGGDAGRRVLSGQIRRGDGETIRAALVMADMRNSTAIAENAGRQVFIDTLNEFFDAVAAPFNGNGGQILSFIGDGFLAVFPCERQRSASQTATRAAMSAARNAVARMAEQNRNRATRGLAPINFGIGMHVGNVMFGNVGLRSRLTFSAFGSAVNEVQRLESLTKKFALPIVASDVFRQYCGGDWKPLGDEKLRGVPEPVAVHAPGPENMALGSDADLTFGADENRSEAEELMLLYRGASTRRDPAARPLN
ncbi:MAG: adenylate/guanylate cyclase domain-containing protein [Proteobacteria bacterium]|nr:adenylate/guanylate cyclase domain-containing protein [Pseudomonadota bacterium]MBS0572108.1 adenylate/guanylate cyclase domain-containing protein [Pseudomonadota bacterium]